MTQPTDCIRYLKAVCQVNFEQYVIFANLNPPNHVRIITELDSTRDCYWSIAAFPLEAKTNLGNNALYTMALVIDDVGSCCGEGCASKVPAGAVELALGRPTAVVETSSGNFQWTYRLSRPVETANWDGFFAGVEALIGHRLEARSAQTLARLPMGVNTKPGKNGFRVRLVELDPEIELDPGTIPRAEPTLSADGGGAEHKHSIEALRELMALIPNKDIDREVWVGIIGHGLKALCADDTEGFEVFNAWSETWTGGFSKGPDYHRKTWDSFGASGGLTSQGGKLKALAEQHTPEKFAQWKAKEVFDDGAKFPAGPEVSKGKAAPHVLASGEFVEGFIAPDYLVKKLITKAFLYSLTGQTGAGKTSITLRLAATVALGRSFGGLGTKPCRVLYLAAENPVDIQMRWIALAAEMGFDAESIGVFFVKGWFKIGTTMKELRAEALRVGGEFGLVVVDTGPVFFEGEDENDRVAMRRHARMMRTLIEIIPGAPTVIVNVHPTKNAGADNLLPAGGGSFLNEVDGNLTAAKGEDQTIELGWQGKWRGVEFAPLDFLLKVVTHPRLVDSDGDAMPTVVCEHLSTDAKESMERAEFVDQDKILAEMAHNSRVSLAELAVHMGWYWASGKPAKAKADRYVKTLIKQKRVKKEGQLWVVAGAQKSKLNGKGPIVSTVLGRYETIETKNY